VNALAPRVCVVLAVAVAPPLTACGGTRPTTETASPPTSTTTPGGHALAGLGDGVCAFARQARAGDAASARTSFFGPVHDDLHQLADELSDTDRPAAGRLLEAKQRVESDLQSLETPGDLEASADELVLATADGLRRLGVTVQECPR
jgi:hypothetical protein